MAASTAHQPAWFCSRACPVARRERIESTSAPGTPTTEFTQIYAPRCVLSPNRKSLWLPEMAKKCARPTPGPGKCPQFVSRRPWNTQTAVTKRKLPVESHWCGGSLVQVGKFSDHLACRLVGSPARLGTTGTAATGRMSAVVLAMASAGCRVCSRWSGWPSFAKQRGLLRRCDLELHHRCALRCQQCAGRGMHPMRVRSDESECYC